MPDRPAYHFPCLRQNHSHCQLVGNVIHIIRTTLSALRDFHVVAADRSYSSAFLHVALIAVWNSVSFLSSLSLAIRSLAIYLRGPHPSTLQCHAWYHPPRALSSVTVFMFLEEVFPLTDAVVPAPVLVVHPEHHVWMTMVVVLG